MSPHTVAFAVVLLVFATGMLVTALVYLPRLQRRKQNSLEALLARITPLDRTSLAWIAEDLYGEADHGSETERLESAQIWDLIGGMDGLLQMEANCAVLIDLASLLQERYPEALVVAEDLRLKTREIQWHLDRLRGAARLGKLEGVFEEYAQRAVASYYGMTQRVLELYAWGDLEAHAELQRVL